MTAGVVSLYPSNFRDAAATLRVIAEGIETGKYGEVQNLVIALNTGTEPSVFGAGEQATLADSVLLLHKAINFLVKL